MPYIKEEKRFDIDRALNDLNSLDVGEMNYLITKLFMKYINENGEKYKHYNDVIGVLECVKLELYRRKVVIYEDVKNRENGDVY